MSDMNEFYAAARDARFQDATLICSEEKNAQVWPEIVLDCIDRIDQEWRLDQISLVEVSGAFWTTRRVLDHMLAQGVPVSGSMRETGRILLCVPREEGHSFGAQLLADQLRRAGYHVTLLVDRPNAEVLRQLKTAHFDVFGVSVGYDQSLLGLADIISEARIVSQNPGMSVALGGSLFEQDASAYAFLNADVLLKTGQDPITFFKKLIPHRESAGEPRHV